ncbi:MULTISPECIES: caspase family protein [unclassified Bradyrhizobium]|uniref:WD40 domain-containing protein n=1 Tax=unclassified Bradyrhizobium TaxID=2631580 RepID=UPI002916682B|nr:MULTISPECIES: caspase family protein [unclassified Bradyrhizobium]
MIERRTSRIFTAFIVTLVVSVGGNSMAADPSASTGLDAQGVAEFVLDTWKNFVEHQGKDDTLLHSENSAAVLCVDWRQFRTSAKEKAFGFSRWWAEWDNATAETSANIALKSCEEWRSTERSSCECQVIAKNLQPALNVMSGAIGSAPRNPPAHDVSSMGSPRLVLQAGHTGNVNKAMFGPNGVQIAYQNGQRASLPQEPMKRVAGLDIVVTEADGVLIIWDRKSGRELRRTPKVGKITSLSMSADGVWILGRDEGSLGHLWNTIDGEEVRTFQGVDFGIALSPDATLAVLSSRDPKSNGVYETATGQQLFRMDLDQIAQAQFSPDGDRVLTSSSGSISLWDIKRGRLLFRTYVPALDEVWLDQTGQRIIARASQIRENEKHEHEAFGTRVLVWDANGQQLFELRRDETVFHVRPTGDPDHLLIVGAEAQLWSLSMSKQLQVFASGPQKPPTNDHFDLPDLNDAVVTPSGRSVVTLHRSGTMRIWNLLTGAQIGLVEDASLKDAGALLVSSTDDEVLTLGNLSEPPRSWSLTELQLLHVFSRNDRLPRLSGVGFTSDGRLEVTSEGRTVVWDLESGRPAFEFRSAPVAAGDRGIYLVGDAGQVVSTRTGEPITHIKHPMAPLNVSVGLNGTRLAAEYRSGEVGLWDLTRGQAKFILPAAVKETSAFDEWHTSRILLSADGQFTAISRGNSVEVLRDDGTSLSTLASPQASEARPLAFSPSGKRLVVGCEDGLARIFKIVSGRLVGQIDLRFGEKVFSWDGDEVVQATFLSDEVVVARSRNGVFRDWREVGNPLIKVDHAIEQSMADSPAGQGVATLSVEVPRVSAFAVSPDVKLVATGGADGTIRLWNSATGERRAVLANNSALVGVAFSPKGDLIAGAGEDGSIKIWKLRSEGAVELATIVNFKDSQWSVFSPSGRFDTNRIEELVGLGWVLPDTRFRTFAPELFMRDYFEPRLIGRELQNPELVRPVPDVASLNRLQPIVRVLSAGGGATLDEAVVRVQASAVDDNSAPNGKTRTDAYDLRLFRDGELVGQWPEASDGSDEIGAWRQRTYLRPEAGAKTVTHDFVVKLPTRGRKGSSVFSAYAFNEDRVKSATASLEYQVPSDVARREARAYVVTVGANSYDAKERQLHFAVRDAEAMRESMSRLDGYKVVPVSLTSDGDDRTRWDATKAKIRAVLSRLAGKSTPSGSLAGVNGVDRLAQATPDDVVIVTFSGHGYTAKDGAFYLLPSDSGKDLDPATKPEVLAQFISGEELSEWLRPIDAGQMAMIIDACHSAASVDQPGFKPGPMGDRGLGQLAYDKAMRILAASQADDVALESNKLKQGLLTYALVHDGLAAGPDGKRAADTNHDGKVTIAEWLRYGEQHTPTLFEDIRAGRKDVTYVGRDSVVEPGFQQKVADHAQTPALFDFAREDPVAFHP